jgi:hypothetical protein
MNKNLLYQNSELLVKKFLDENHLKYPIVELNSNFSDCGAFYYRDNKIVVNISNCSSIGKSGMRWSYPGYVIDRTPYGVLCHEIGHYIDKLYSSPKTLFSYECRKYSKENKITNYCPNTEEWFAEIFRLFLTNPDFLKVFRPKTFNFIKETGIQYTENRKWQEVLQHAPIRTLQMAEKKLRESYALQNKKIF